MKKLENDSNKLFRWFEENQMKANKNICHLITNSNTDIIMHVGDIEIKNSSCEKLLGLMIDSQLTLHEQLNGIIKKASKKVNVLSRITPYMNTAKRRILMNSFFASQFGYCRLIWMFHNHTINNKINGLHERSLRIVYSDKNSNYEQLLEKDGSVSIHNRNLQILATEMFKVSKNLSITIVKDIFQRKESPLL